MKSYVLWKVFKTSAVSTKRNPMHPPRCLPSTVRGNVIIVSGKGSGESAGGLNADVLPQDGKVGEALTSTERDGSRRRGSGNSLRGQTFRREC